MPHSPSAQPLRKNRALVWTPRILSIAAILFLSLFALDVFGEKNWPIALFMHLIPSFLLTILAVIAWKKPAIGGILFFAGGFFLAVFSHFRGLPVAAPIMLVGILFLLPAFHAKTGSKLFFLR